jgi:membrane associated rhomboid family serine protease
MQSPLCIRFAASGAISGILGAYVFLFRRRKIYFYSCSAR